MTDAMTVIIDAICQVAPEIEPAEIAGLDGEAVLGDELELDSMDQLNVVTAVFERTGVDIPDRDYPEIRTKAGFEAYLGSRL